MILLSEMGEFLGRDDVIFVFPLFPVFLAYAIAVGAKNAAAKEIKQSLIYCGTEEGKLLEVRNLAKRGLHPPVMLFVQSKERAQQLYRELSLEGIPVEVSLLKLPHNHVFELFFRCFLLEKHTSLSHSLDRLSTAIAPTHSERR